MKQAMARLFLMFFFTLVFGSVVAAAGSEVLEYAAYPAETNNFAEASFSCVLPEGPARGILFLAGGTDSDARPWLRDSRWQALATKERLALVAACLRGAGEAYEVAAEGSGQALLDAVAEFAKQSGRTELSALPLILYGHSAGAQFAFNFACWKPERVRAIVCLKSGPLRQPNLRGTLPFRALFIVGERDLNGRVREVARAYHTGRSAGAPWCFAFQPDGGHGADGCSEIVDSFVEATNLPEEDTLYATLSHPKREAVSNREAVSDPTWTWLPNRSFARVWTGFVTSVSPGELTRLPDDPAPERLSWQPITAFPEQVDLGDAFIQFEYAVSGPETAGGIKDAKVTVSGREIIATVTRSSDARWVVSGKCDLRPMPSGPFRAVLNIEVLTSTGARVRGDLPLFTRLKGPISVSPASVYYGVIPREGSAEFKITLRSDSPHPIRSCQASCSDPNFLAVSLTPATTPGSYEAKCIVSAGARIGERTGKITFRVETDREHLITVPYYGFVRK